MNPYHQELLDLLRQEADANPFESQHNYQNYTGSQSGHLPLRKAQERQIARSWAKENGHLAHDEFISLLDSLYQGKSGNEKTVASLLLEYSPEQRKLLDPKNLDRWLNHLQGWAEVDSLCQSNFTSREVLDRWSSWKSLLHRLRQSSNLNKKRASLVLLIKPLRESDDRRLSSFAFGQIDKLKTLTDPLITKAVSWLLRGLIKHHRSEVQTYLEENDTFLPAIAVRETRKKLLTGTKT